jgi:HSP20 family molecular chaperone IbpA
MHSCKSSLATRTSKLPRSIPKTTNIARPTTQTFTITPSRKMASFFRPHSHYYNAEPNFQGLFRLLDDFDRYSSQNGSGRGATVPTFTPKFDMKETETGYELHGELPGVSKDDVHLEFTDPQTLQVRGKVERTHTEGEPPAGLLEGTGAENKPITEAGEDKSASALHKATVEDDPEETTTASPTESGQAEPQQQEQAVQKAAPAAAAAAESQKPQSRYYLVERSIGTFARSFHFPSRVDTESVQASLRDGILTVTVQKARKHEGRRITVN